MRALSIGKAAEPGAAEDRLLVIADAQCDATAVCEAIVAHLVGAAAVHVVVPVRVSQLHFLADDEGEERRQADACVRTVVALVGRRFDRATGVVGTDTPLGSMCDALASVAATRVLLVTPPEKDSYWLEHNLLPHARRLAAVPVSQVIVRPPNLTDFELGGDAAA